MTNMVGVKTCSSARATRARFRLTGHAGSRARAQAFLRLCAVACVTLLVMNGCFLAARLADGLSPRGQLSTSMSRAYENGAMSVDPWPRNALDGRDRYSDCITAQIAVLGDDGLLRNAIAPRLMSPEQVGHGASQHNACDELRQYLDGSARPQPGVTYTRFWHGASSALNLALLAMPVDGYRALLLDATLGLVAATAVAAALAGPPLLIALAPLLVASFAFGGQFGYGQLLSYGPSMIAVWLVALVLVVERDRMTEERLVRFAVVAGALEAFFDQMISVPLTAGIFLVVAGTVPQFGGGERSGRVAMRSCGLLAAWTCGLVGSYAVKLGLTVLLLGRGALSDFTQQLAYRAGTVDPEVGLDPALHISRLGAAGRALLRCFVNLWRLGYTDEPGLLCVVVAVVATLGWVLALGMWLRAARAGQGSMVVERGAGYILASLVVAGWFLVFPQHALRHTFTVRATLIWIIGGWGWFCASGKPALPSGSRRPLSPPAEPA